MSAFFPHPKAILMLEDKTVIDGCSFGFSASTLGEVVFNTGMVGYVESLTDPSYAGQILVFTYPLVGNYGVPRREFFESEKIHVKGLVVSEYSQSYTNAGALMSLDQWLKEEKIPAMWGVDTRMLTKMLREKGVMLAKIIMGGKDPGAFVDPNKENLVATVSVARPRTYGKGRKKVMAIDCGMKENIIRNFLRRDVSVKRVPWDYDVTQESFDGLFISNGPGDPQMCQATINTIVKVMKLAMPIFGICLGNQLLALAAGAKTYKLRYGHRGQNQPVMVVGTKRCYITSHNHGYSVDAKTIPGDWEVWFWNANDHTVEGVRHKKKPWFGVQFHPEASPGPTDTEWLFDEFVNVL